MPTLDMTTISGIQVIPRKISPLKHKVQDLINLGKLKFEESNGLVRVEDQFEAKAEMIRQEEKSPMEAGSWKVAI